MELKNWKNFSLLTFSGLMVCLIIGFLLAGTNAILPGHLASQFTLYGLFASLLYAILKFGTNRDFIFVTILFILLDIVLLGHGNPAKFIVHGIYALFLSGSVFVYTKFRQSMLLLCLMMSYEDQPP